MPKRFLLIISLFSLTFTSLSQEGFLFMGVITLEDNSLISYNINFEIADDGLIRGHSLTDVGGAHETKSFISGFFDDAANTIEFYESDILYTKSEVTSYDFCFVHFSGRLRKANENQQIKGKFEGQYSDGQKCVNGEIILTGYNKVLRKTQRLDRKIDKSLLVKKEDKERIDLTKMLDSLSMNFIKKDEVLNVFTKGSKVEMVVFDGGREDGDRITIRVDGDILVRDYEATNQKKTFVIPIEKEKTRVTLTSESTGSIGANTVRINLKNSEGTIETSTNFKGGESAQIEMIRKD